MFLTRINVSDYMLPCYVLPLAQEGVKYMQEYSAFCDIYILLPQEQDEDLLVINLNYTAVASYLLQF